MSRPDLLTFRWSLFLCAVLATILGLAWLFGGPLPMDEAGLVHVSRWWILLEIPPTVYIDIRYFGIGLTDEEFRGRVRREAPFLIPVFSTTVTGFLMSLGGGLWIFAACAGGGLVAGSIFQAGSLILPQIARWKIWIALKR